MYLLSPGQEGTNLRGAALPSACAHGQSASVKGGQLDQSCYQGHQPSSSTVSPAGVGAGDMGMAKVLAQQLYVHISAGGCPFLLRPPCFSQTLQRLCL